MNDMESMASAVRVPLKYLTGVDHALSGDLTTYQDQILANLQEVIRPIIEYSDRLEHRLLLAHFRHRRRRHKKFSK